MVCFNVIPQTIEYTIETVVILELRGRRAIELAEAALVRGSHKTLGLFSFFVVVVPVFLLPILDVVPIRKVLRDNDERPGLLSPNRCFCHLLRPVSFLLLFRSDLKMGVEGCGAKLLPVFILGRACQN